MSFGEFINKAKEMISEHPDQARDALDRAEQMLNEQTGGKYADQISKGGDMLEGRLGLPDEQVQTPTEPTQTDPTQNDSTQRDPVPSDPAMPDSNETDPVRPSDSTIDESPQADEIPDQPTAQPQSESETQPGTESQSSSQTPSGDNPFGLDPQ